MFDVAVVGLGLIGGATLRHVASTGSRCIGIGPSEPVDLSTHTGRFASHFDSGRITRILDRRLQRAVLASRAIAQYGPLARAADLDFHRPVGCILTAQDPAHFDDIVGVAATLNTAHEIHRVGASSLDDRLQLPPTVAVAVEPPPAGHIDPRIMLQAQLRVAASDGAAIRRDEVVALSRHNGTWTIDTASGARLLAHSVVVAAGAHLDEIEGRDLRGVFQVFAETVVMAHLDARERDRLDGLPSLVAQVDDGVIDDIYMVPPTTYPDGSVRIKLGASLQRSQRLPDFAARHAWMSGSTHREELTRLRSILEATVPGLRAEHWSTKPCLISDTQSGLPVVDMIDDGLVLAAGCNGSAAKSADAIGALAAGLVLRGEWTDEQLHATDFAVTAGASAFPADVPDR